MTNDYAVFRRNRHATASNFRRHLRHSDGMDHIDVLGAGAAVGLAVALPFGPIGLMVVALGRRDWRSGAAAAAGVAAADLTWAVAAVVGGTALAALPGLDTWQALARAALVIIGVLLVVRGSAALRRGGSAGGADPGPSRAPLRWFAALFGLTLPNPLTVAVFTAAAVSIGVDDRTSARAVFALGVGLTSLAWQLLLAATGRHLLARAGPSAGAALTITGGIVLVGWPLLTG
jgi:threonine/homoserine/homoserine lactone efflux protein